MVRKASFGLLWFVIIYVMACGVIGAIAGAQAGINDPAHAQEVGGIAGASTVAAHRALIAGASALIAIVGSAAGVLPGTKSRRAGA